MKKYNNIKVLFIYDELLEDFQALTEYIKEFDYTFLNSYRNAIRHVKRQHFDVILSAIDLKGNFCEFLENVREMYPHIPVFMIAEKVPDDKYVDLINLRVNYVYSRPVDKENLINNIIANSHRQPGRATRNNLASYRMENHYTAVIKNQESAIVSFLETINSMLELLYPVEYGDFSELKMALYEALMNASQYGSKKEDDEITINSHLSPDRIIFQVRDSGSGFDHKDTLEKQINGKLKSYGLKMIQFLADDISFNRLGNVISIMKLITPEKKEINK